MELNKGKGIVPPQALDIPKVLIVDDSELMRNLLHTAITQWGYQTVEASDGEEAWEIMQQADAPRLLILDWLMPKLDGIALCKRIRQQLGHHTYIIFLTQVFGKINIIKGFEAGADEFLLKPVNFSELRSRIFAGEKILEYLKVIEDQQKELKQCFAYIKTLEKVISLMENKG